MKKIITLAFAALAFGTLQAQTTKEEARRVVLGDGGKTTQTKSENPRDVILGGGNNTSSTSRQAEIDRVNRDYDAKIISIRNNPNLTQEEKNRAIAQLERDRARKIREINGQTGTTDKKAKKDKHKNKNKKAKGNNGKHLGWEKGVGNPHKNGGKPKGKNKN